MTVATSARHVLVCRLDSMGDVLLTGGAIRAAARQARVTALVGPAGRAAAALLPGVSDVVSFDAPWVPLEPGAVRREAMDALVDEVASREVDAALIFTSFHQSPLPLALLLRMAGVPWVGAASVDYPGSLLDLRHSAQPGLHEAEQSLSLAAAAGFEADDRGAALAVRQPLPDVSALTGSPLTGSALTGSPIHLGEPYVVVHPGAATPARRPTAAAAAAMVTSLVAAGHRVLVTGGRQEMALTAAVAVAGATDLGGRVDLPELAAVLAGAQVVVASNTGPAHLAAAVGTPVVSLFAPVVPSRRWAPYGVPVVLLGDQQAPCRDTRARQCPVPGHPCLDAIVPGDVVAAVRSLSGADPEAFRTTSMHLPDPGASPSCTPIGGRL
jgi:ADP-heptose:LPS heptosyltransferase